MKRTYVAAVAALALVAVQAHGALAQQAPVIITPGPAVIVPGPAPTVVAPAPAPTVVVPAPAASPATVTVITTTVAAPRFCGGAYRPDAGTNFGGCS